MGTAVKHPVPLSDSESPYIKNTTKDNLTRT